MTWCWSAKHFHTFEIDFYNYYFTFIKSSLNGTYKMIGDKFRRNPNSTLVGNIETGVERAASGSFAFLEVLIITK